MAEVPGDGDISYAARFQDAAAARAYDRSLYAAGTFDSYLAAHEHRYILGVLSRYFSSGKQVRYLDFACGTGRILSVLSPHVGLTVGVDVSEQMLSVAREKLPGVRLHRIADDWYSLGPPPELRASFDLATAFRFFLNAEGRARRRGLRLLRQLLSEDGLLVANIHGNSRSLRFLSATARRVVGGDRSVNQMSLRTFSKLLRQGGFEPIEWTGFSLLTPRAFGLLNRISPSLVGQVDRLTERFPFLKRFAVDLVVVARRVG